MISDQVEKQDQDRQRRLMSRLAHADNRGWRGLTLSPDEVRWLRERLRDAFDWKEGPAVSYPSAIIADSSQGWR